MAGDSVYWLGSSVCGLQEPELVVEKCEEWVRVCEFGFWGGWIRKFRKTAFVFFGWVYVMGWKLLRGG